MLLVFSISKIYMSMILSLRLPLPIVKLTLVWERFYFKDSYLLRADKLCVPESSLCLLLLQESHGGGLVGHFGREKTYATLAHKYFWPRMLHDVGRIINRCSRCRKAKSKAQPHGLYTPLPIPHAPWEDIIIDFILGFPKTRDGKDSIFVVVDIFSKTTHSIPCHKSDDALNIAISFV